MLATVLWPKEEEKNNETVQLVGSPSVFAKGD
jgi:hypothetical protein